MERRGAAIVFVLHGRIYEMEALRLEKELITRLDEGAKLIVLDLADVPFVTSTCLGALMMGHKHARKSGGAIRVARPVPLVRRILEVTKLNRLFGVYDSVDAAIADQ